MAKTLSTMIMPLGTQAPDFSLPDTSGNTVSLADFIEKPLLVAFICNHCPFVKYIIDDFARIAKEYQDKSVGVVGINPNDIENYPDDKPEKMAELVQEKVLTFPYLFDESQEVAKTYKAACTPDFFLFDREKRLVYRGQMDDSRPGGDIPVTGKDLTDAVERVLAGQAAVEDQKPSMGCNIKWKKGNEPDYFMGGG